MISLTHEQNAPIVSGAKKKVVMALAGTGKSTLLRFLATQNPTKSFLYIVFNTDNAVSARATFPSNVKVSTWHALAHEYVGKFFSHKYKQPFSLRAIKNILQTNDWDAPAVIKEIITNYSNSADVHINVNHIPEDSVFRIQPDKIVEMAKTVWSVISDPSNNTPCTHDTYSKVWALTKPVLNYDEILFDEGQDSNDLIMSVLSAQKGKFTIVGDRNQQIYGFRNSVNSLEHSHLSDAEAFPLTQSFRFGPKVAKVANVVLSLTGEKLRLVGLPSIQSEVYNKAISFDYDPNGHQRAYISRTVMGTIDCALNLIDKGYMIYWGGGIERYNLDGLMDLQNLKMNRLDNIKNKDLLKQYEDFDDYTQQAKASADAEMNRTIRIIENYQGGIFDVVKQLKASATKDKEKAAFVVTTAHRAKGMEFPVVFLNEDFNNPVEVLAAKKKISSITKKDINAYIEELNLLYVATTRAIIELYINTALSGIITHVKSIIDARKEKSGSSTQHHGHIQHS